MKQEIRFLEMPLELDQQTDQTAATLPTMRGYAAVFRSDSLDLGGFIERIEPGAFADAIRTTDVIALVNHDTSKPLGRLSNGRLKLSEDMKGLMAEIMPSDTTYARDLVTAVRDRTVKGMSFRFTVPTGGDSWKRENGQNIRTIRKASIDEVSIVTFPAYPSTSIALRAVVDEQAAKQAIEQLDQQAQKPEENKSGRKLEDAQRILRLIDEMNKW